MLFTAKEKLVIQFLVTTAIIGVATGLVRSTWRERHPVALIAPAKQAGKVVDGDTIRANSGENDVQNSSEIVNINIANKEQLTGLPEVGPVTAERIIQYREDYGEFNTIDDLLNIPGIGPKKLEKIQPFIRFN